MADSIYGLYQPKTVREGKTRVLFLLREPGEKYNPQNPGGNEVWWEEVKKGEEQRYSSCFLKLLSCSEISKDVPSMLNEVDFANLYYANIFPWGGGGYETDACKMYVKGDKKGKGNKDWKEKLYEQQGLKWDDCKDRDEYDDNAEERLKKIVSEVCPNVIFTCIDIYDLIGRIYPSFKTDFDNDGISYCGKNNQLIRKRCGRGKIDDVDGNKVHEIKVYEIYHPAYYAKLT